MKSFDGIGVEEAYIWELFEFLWFDHFSEAAAHP